MIEQVLIAVGWFLSGFVFGIAFTKYCRSKVRKIRQERLFQGFLGRPAGPNVTPCCHSDGCSPDSDGCSPDSVSLCLERERGDRF